MGNSDGNSKSKTDAEQHVRAFVQELLGLWYSEPESWTEASEKTKIPRERIRQAVKYGKGSIDSIGILVAHGFGIKPSQLSSLIPKLRKEISREASGDWAYFNDLLEKVIARYSLKELIAWLELLIQKFKIEKKLGLRRKTGAGRPKG